MLMNSIWSVMLCLGLPVLTPLSDPLAELVLALEILQIIHYGYCR